jgi:hypothetical protein
VTRDYDHEGATIWSWSTFDRIRQRLRLTVSTFVTPTASVMLTPGFCPTYKSEQQYRRELERRMDTWAEDHLRRRLQCPAKHPVIPYELRVTMAGMGLTRKLFIQAFPNAFESAFAYVPVPFYFCVQCQEVYRQRECEAI